jgi:hypothetical protein
MTGELSSADSEVELVPESAGKGEATKTTGGV